MEQNVRGFSTDNNRFSNFECYNLSVTRVGSPSLELGVDRQYSVTSMARNFGTNVVTGISSIGVPIFKYVSLEISLFGAASGASSFLSSSLSEQSSDAFVYAAIYNFPTLQYTTSSFGEEVLTDIGRTHYNTWLARNNSQDPYFRQVCGDMIVTSKQEYAAVYYSINVKYNSLFSSSSISSTNGGSIGLLDFSSSVSSSISTGSISGLQSMRAYQVGGDLVDFTQQVSSSLTCSINSTSPCESLSQSWQNYATSFVRSVESNGNAITRGNPVLSSISGFGFDPGVSQLTPDVIAARSQIESIYNTNKKYVSALEGYQRLIHSTPSMSSSFESKVGTLLSVVSNNLDIVENNFNGAIQCYDVPTSCPSILAGINSRITPLTPSLLNLYDNSFSHYYTNFFGCTGVNLIPNGNGNWILDSNVPCTLTLQSHVRKLCSDNQNYECSNTGSVVSIELVDFSNVKIANNAICGTLFYRYEGNPMQTGVQCSTRRSDDTFFCNGNLKTFEGNAQGPGLLGGKQDTDKAKCTYYANSPSTTTKQTNPYYISDFSAGNSSETDNDLCPGLDEYSGCSGLSSGEVAAIVICSLAVVVGCVVASVYTSSSDA